MVMTADIETRMLAKAETDHVELAPLGDGVYLTHSRRTPAGIVYRTTWTSCDCRGFQTHGHCKHMARVKAICPRCQDAGVVPSHWSISAASHGVSQIPCPRCTPTDPNPWRYAS
jgi:hypothetical protein